MVKIELPEECTAVQTAFYRLANGGHANHYLNKEFGIIIIKIKPDRDSPWITKMTHPQIPEKEFGSFREMKEYVLKHNQGE